MGGREIEGGGRKRQTERDRGAETVRQRDRDRDTETETQTQKTNSDSPTIRNKNDERMPRRRRRQNRRKPRPLSSRQKDHRRRNPSICPSGPNPTAVQPSRERPGRRGHDGVECLFSPSPPPSAFVCWVERGLTGVGAGNYRCCGGARGGGRGGTLPDGVIGGGSEAGVESGWCADYWYWVCSPPPTLDASGRVVLMRGQLGECVQRADSVSVGDSGVSGPVGAPVA